MARQGHAQRREIHAKNRSRAWFDAWAGSYDRSLLNHLLFRPCYLAMLEEIARWRRGRTGAFHVLDVGCGTGSFARELLSTGWPVSVVGLDYSSAMCAGAAAKLSKLDPSRRAHVLAGDSEHLPFRAAGFDIVTCANSFHHYPRHTVVVGELRRVLRPGGRLILVDGFRDNAVGWLIFDVLVAAVEQHVHHATWREIHACFESAGFRPIHRRKLNVIPPALITSGDVPDSPAE